MSRRLVGAVLVIAWIPVALRAGASDRLAEIGPLLLANKGLEGAPGVIATLWNIGDDAAEALMEEFYCRLRAGDSIADALRIAQLALVGSDFYQAPAYWAAFSLTGNPQGRWRTRCG